MSKQYTREHLKLSIVKILQTLGWNTINTSPLEILTDILSNYMTQITRSTNSYANEFGCTQSNLDHLGLTFRDMGISIAELEEYVRYVNFGPPPHPVPKYPIPKEDHLNFLKPGSKEVVTRPIHIPEHLPPMNPLLEGDLENVNCKTEEPEENNTENQQVFKKPVDVSPSEFKRPSFRREEEGSRPTREISSVMMTTSGFLSPAREGKLPESRTPITSVEPTSPASQTSDTVDLNKKPKLIKKIDRKRAKPSSGPGPGLTTSPNIDHVIEEKKKKQNSMKWMLKSKQQQQQPPHQQLPSQLQKLQNKLQNSLPQNNEVNISPVQNKITQHIKDNKALAAARLKTEKLNTTITPVTIRPVSNPPTFLMDHDNVDKLFTEPDKKKVNIFKKISNVKERPDFKVGKKDEVKQEFRESSPDLIIDEPEEVISKLTHISSDVTIEPISSMVINKTSDKAETPYFDDDSQPGTPLTPKTPEMISHSPPVIKEKRKRKETKKKRIPKVQSPHRLDSDVMDIDMERPKTPEPHVIPKLELPMSLPNHPHTMGGMPFFNFGGPGLIPPINPLIPNLPFSPMMYNFGQKPPLSTFHQRIPEPLPLPTPLSQEEQVPEEFPANQRLLPEKPPVSSDMDLEMSPSSKSEKKSKEHKKEKKDKIKKRNKKDKIKNKAEKKKLKEEKKEKIRKEKKEKRNKDKEIRDSDSPGVKITLKLRSPSPRPDTPETRKLTIKPVIKKEDVIVNAEERIKRETSPGLAKISALVCGPPKPKPVNPPRSIPPAEDATPEELPITPAPKTGPGPGRPRIHPIKPKPTKPKKRRQPVKKDAEGNEVWICPGCGNQDDGSPMIGCDGCDAWYHWVCVGIQVPPDDSEDWYCRHCISKKNDDLQSDKQKKKRKKKEKKEH